MSNHLNFFIDGNWVAPVVPATLDVIDPSTEEAYTRISVGSKADVDRAVAAAKAAFPAFSQTSKAERLKLLRRILEIYNERYRGHRPGRLAGDGRADRPGRARRRPGPAGRIWNPPSRRWRTSNSSEQRGGTASWARSRSASAR